MTVHTSIALWTLLIYCEELIAEEYKKKQLYFWNALFFPFVCSLNVQSFKSRISITHPDTSSFGISAPKASAMSLDPMLAMHCRASDTWTGFLKGFTWTRFLKWFKNTWTGFLKWFKTREQGSWNDSKTRELGSWKDLKTCELGSWNDSKTRELGS